MYNGLQDQCAGTQIISNEAALKFIISTLREYFTGFSVYKTIDGYIVPYDKPYVTNGFMIEIFATNICDVEKVASIFNTKFNQEYIYINKYELLSKKITSRYNCCPII